VIATEPHHTHIRHLPKEITKIVAEQLTFASTSSYSFTLTSEMIDPKISSRCRSP
jgi:hypothetical protein